MRSGARVLIGLFAIVSAGCAGAAPGAPGDSAPPAMVEPTTASIHPAPSASATAVPTPDPEIEQAIRFRHDFGLRFDRDWVIAAGTDPTASEDPFGVPLYPDEVAQVLANEANTNATTPIVVGYASAFPDESGGVYVDRDAHPGVVTALFTNNLAKHASALAGLANGHPVIVRQVRYTYAELDTLMEWVFADIDWMEAIPARMQGLGVDVIKNVIEMEVSSAEPTASRQITDRYGLGDRLVVTSDGTGAALLPSGNVHGTVRTKSGKVPGRNADLQVDFVYQESVPGHCGGGDIGYGVRDNGTFDYGCQAGRRIIVIYGTNASGDRVELGRATVNVVAGKTVNVKIRLTRNP